MYVHYVQTGTRIEQTFEKSRMHGQERASCSNFEILTKRNCIDKLTLSKREKKKGTTYDFWNNGEFMQKTEQSRRRGKKQFLKKKKKKKKKQTRKNKASFQMEYV